MAQLFKKWNMSHDANTPLPEEEATLLEDIHHTPCAGNSYSPVKKTPYCSSRESNESLAMVDSITRDVSVTKATGSPVSVNRMIGADFR